MANAHRYSADRRYRITMDWDTYHATPGQLAPDVWAENMATGFRWCVLDWRGVFAMTHRPNKRPDYSAINLARYAECCADQEPTHDIADEPKAAEYPRTRREVEAYLAAHGIATTLVAGRGYFYFWGEAEPAWPSSSVCVAKLGHLTLGRWLLAYRELEAAAKAHRLDL